MATTTAPSAGASEPKASVSEAIHAGADLFVALFEAEKTKVTTAYIRTIWDLQARFSELQQGSQSSISAYARRCADFEATIRTAQTAHAQAVAEASLVREQMLETQRQLTQVKHELDHIKTCSRAEHSSCHKSTLSFAPDQAGNGATAKPKDVQHAEVQADDLHMLFSLGELRRQLMATQQRLEEKERDCNAVEKERDDLKAGLGTQVMMLNNRIFSLHAELESLKSLPSRSQMGRRDREALVDVATPAVAHDNTTLSSSVPREDVSQKDDIPPSETRSHTDSPLPLSDTSTVSQLTMIAAMHRPSRNGPSVTRRVPLATSGVVSTHAASDSSPSFTVPPSMTSTSSSSAMDIFGQVDDDKVSSKRPASGSVGLSLETGAKRVKLDHLSHDNSPIPKDPSHQSSSRATNGLNIRPASSEANSVCPSGALRSPSNSGGESRVKAKLEGNASHRLSPRVSDNQNDPHHSRPKPRPAYRGRVVTPSNSTTDGTCADGSAAALKPLPPPRPKPRPAYQGSNSIRSGSTSLSAPGNTD